MIQSQLNPSQYVERIRQTIADHDSHHTDRFSPRHLPQITAHMAHDKTPKNELESYNHQLEEISSQLAARIDARFREMMTHLQTELGQWKGEMNHSVLSLQKIKVDRTELKHKFGQLAQAASAAMEDDTSSKSPNGFVL